MNLPLLIFALRIASAAVLLGFFGLMAWLLVRDLRTSRQLLQSQQPELGALRVIQSTSGNPPPDTIFTIGAQTSIGRSARNTIVLDEAYVSAEHALLARRDNRWWLEDLGSRNGTLLNDLPLAEPTIVSSGDVVTIGGVELRLELDGDASPG
jgi:pSer/pThr/pTyr-binding forkhead associated (FHA) protein